MNLKENKTANFEWDSFLIKIKDNLDSFSFDGWVAPLSFNRIDGNILFINSPSQYIKNWVISNFKELFLQILKEYYSEIKYLEIIVNPINIPKDITLENDAISSNIVNDASNYESNLNNFEIRLNPEYTFDTFVVGKPNEFAYNACKRVSTDKSLAFNPLFIHGGVGLGKTHLMHSIAWLIKKENPNTQIMYVTAETFMNQFITAIMDKNVLTFKELFRSTDVLLIDDFQFISGKGSTQEEFFHTFNALISDGKKIIMSADKSPAGLDNIEARIVSRLQGGLSVDIHETTYELRLGILSAKSKQLNTEIPPNVLEFLAHSFTSNVRELEGGLKRVILYHQLMNAPITLDMAMTILQEELRNKNKPISIDLIQKKVAEHYNVKMADLSSAKKDKTTSSARHVAMYITKQITKNSFPEIGKKYGGRDHSTVLYSVKKVEEAIKKDALLNNEIRMLIQVIQKS